MGLRGYQAGLAVLQGTRQVARAECGLCGRALRGASAIAAWALFGPAAGCAILILMLSPARVCGTVFVALPLFMAAIVAYATAAAVCSALSVFPCTRDRASRLFAADERVWASVYNLVWPQLERKVRIARMAETPQPVGGGNTPPPPPPPPPPPAPASNPSRTRIGHPPPRPPPVPSRARPDAK